MPQGMETSPEQSHTKDENKAEVTEIKDALHALCHFLADYRYLMRLSPVDFFYLRAWEDARFPDWLKRLGNTIDVANTHCSTLTSLSRVVQSKELDDLLENVKRLSDQDDWLHPQSRFSYETFDAYVQSASDFHNPTLLNGMNPKKEHEITRAAACIDSILTAGRIHVDQCIEMGCGYGYLLSYLSLSRSLRAAASPTPCSEAPTRTTHYVGLDMNANNVKGAAERHAKMSTYGPIKALPLHNPVDFACCRVSFPPEGTFKTLLGEEPVEGAPRSESMFVSLHGCGSLSTSMLRLYHASQQSSEVPRPCAFLFQVGCCYQLLREATPSDDHPCAADDSQSEDISFPMSDYLRHEHPVRLGKNAMNLATSSQEQDPHASYQDRFGRFVTVDFYSALFHIMCVREGVVTGRDALMKLGTLRNMYRMTFPEFALLMSTRKGLPAFPSDVIERYHAAYHAQFNLFVWLVMLQKCVSSLLERVILLDRLLYCRERGHVASLVRLFDRIQSPRSIALFIEPHQA